MKAYILTIIGASLLSVMTHILAPEQWRKYIKIVTGLVVVSVLVMPIRSLTKVDIFEDFTIETSGLDMDIQKKAVAEELEKRIAADIEERIEQEFYQSCTAQAKIRVNASFEIEGVEAITIRGFRGDQRAAANRMAEVYGIGGDKVAFAK